ncbi:DUF6894 family protein [Microvirga roseola]|uniref:DUF6894 family protein n=1 Tax=Microvirga roseola TaxID=2883126 RepID=UPI001E31A21E|nr:hypothetical protein [Microvirga roseola]
MRCYFHLVNGREIIPDDSGVEVSDLASAHGLALQAIREIREEADQVDEEWRGWQLDVVCPQGSILLSIPLETRMH